MNIAHIIARTENLKTKTMGSPRYEAFQKVIGKENNFFFLPYDEFMKGVEYKVPVTPYRMEQGKFVAQDKTDLSLDAALIEYYDATDIEQKKKDMFETIPCYAKDNEVTLVNNSKSMHSQDKLFLYQHQFPIAPPKTYHFTETEQLMEKAKEGGHIIKPRFGSEGNGVEQLTPELAKKLKDLQDYIFQEEITAGLLGELRLIYGYQGQFLGSRFILDRNKPWEKLNKKKYGKIHVNIPALPSTHVINDGRRIYEKAGCEIASVDFFIINKDVSVKDIYNKGHINDKLVSDLLRDKNNYKFIEINGFGTGYGNPAKQIYLMQPDGRLGALNEMVAQGALAHITQSQTADYETILGKT